MTDEQYKGLIDEIRVVHGMIMGILIGCGVSVLFKIFS